MQKKPEVGNTLLVKIKSDGDGHFSRTPPVIFIITHVYSHDKVKVSSGDIWFVQPCQSNKAHFETKRA